MSARSLNNIFFGGMQDMVGKKTGKAMKQMKQWSRLFFWGACFVFSVLLLWLNFFSIHPPPVFASTRGIQVVAQTEDGSSAQIDLYSGYYALVVGCGNYQGGYEKGWPKLTHPVKDAREVAGTLRDLGWEVRLLEDPAGKSLEKAINDMTYGPGRDPQKAILFWFSGHGHTEKKADGSKLGYIVPVDAPDPADDPSGFTMAAINMRQMETCSERIQAKHVLMVFDSCFSGSVFLVGRARPPKIIQTQVARPVRQFITAGTEDQEVPDQSIFKRCFIQGLTKRDADLNRDGYVTGQEMGMFLQTEVTNAYPGQVPQYGKIRNPALNKGDFVFRLASGSIGITKKAHKTTLSVKGNCQGASVLIDGQYVDTMPISDIPLSPGDHRIRVENEGYEPYNKTIHITEGRTMSLYVDLSREKPQVGRLFVVTVPAEAAIKILNIKPRFYQGIELAPGRYQIEVSAKGYESQQKGISLSAGEDKNIMVRLDKVQKVEGGTGALALGQTFTNSLGMKFAYIPPGTFMMGSPKSEKGRGDDETRHKVTLTKGFYLGSTEVTVGQFRAFVNETKYRTEAEKGDGAYVWAAGKWQMKKDANWKNPYFQQNEQCPVVYISWSDAYAFCRWLTKKTGKNYRLPTEAEWEYACRAGSTTALTNGDIAGTECGYEPNLDQIGWYCGNSNKRTHPVAQKKPNAWGLYDMHGNAWEWCQDWYGYGDYRSGAVTDPQQGPSSGSDRVVRGGGWDYFARHCRSAWRVNESALRDRDLGFRLVGTN